MPSSTFAHSSRKVEDRAASEAVHCWGRPMSFNTSSHKMSGVRSPVLASAMSFSAIASLMPSLRNGVIGTALLPYQAAYRLGSFCFHVEPAGSWRIVAGGAQLRTLLQGVVCPVTDVLKSGGFACPRCKAIMDEVVRIAPLASEPGLIGYECPACRYVTSVVLQPRGPSSGAR
jgi:hypothetical protein